MAESTTGMHLAAWLTFVLTCVAAFTVWLTLVSTQATLDVTRDIGKRQLRAYMTITEGEVFMMQEGPVLVLTMMNCGTTPAINVQFRSRGRTCKVTEQVDFAIEESPPGAAKSRLIIGGGKDSRMERTLDEFPLEEFIAKKSVLYVWGDIKYDDMYGEPHTTKFRFALGGPFGARLSGESISLSPCDAGNEMT